MLMVLGTAVHPAVWKALNSPTIQRMELPGAAGSGPSTAVFQFSLDGVFRLHGLQHSAWSFG